MDGRRGHAPDRFFDEPLTTPAGTGVTLSRAGLARMIASYYAAHGWTDRGDVPVERLSALGLDALLTSAEGSPA